MFPCGRVSWLFHLDTNLLSPSLVPPTFISTHLLNTAWTFSSSVAACRLPRMGPCWWGASGWCQLLAGQFAVLALQPQWDRRAKQNKSRAEQSCFSSAACWPSNKGAYIKAKGLGSLSSFQKQTLFYTLMTAGYDEQIKTNLKVTLGHNCQAFIQETL